MTVQIKDMSIDHYNEIFAMWQITSKRALSKADSREEIERYLNRNKGLSQIAVVDGKIVGTVLVGHDGRRGFIHHMAVMPEYRRQGIAKAMAEKAVEKLAKEGIIKTHIFIYCDNSAGKSFWGNMGFEKRNDIFVYSYEKKND